LYPQPLLAKAFIGLSSTRHHTRWTYAGVCTCLKCVFVVSNLCPVSLGFTGHTAPRIDNLGQPSLSPIQVGSQKTSYKSRSYLPTGAAVEQTAFIAGV